MRKNDGDDALRSFQHCMQIYEERLQHFTTNSVGPPKQLLVCIARLKSHSAQAAHLAASSLKRQERSRMLEKLQHDLVEASKLDHSQPDVWNALALLHLVEGGESGARDVLRSIRCSFPDYLDALNNLGLAELAVGNQAMAISCFQKVILLDSQHPEALSNYAVILLQNGMYDAAIRAFETAVEGSHTEGRGLAFAWGGLAIARCAMGMLTEGLDAAKEAERMADPANKPKFSMLLTSIQARVVTEDTRRGISINTATRLHRELEPKTSTPVDNAVLKLRALARDIRSSASHTALGAVLRLRHAFSGEETGNRNFGAEAAERLVEALEKDDDDATAWVQLALLQMGTGEFASSREFAMQAIARDDSVEAGWNSMAVSCQLNAEVPEAEKCYGKAVEVTKKKYDRRRSNFAGSKHEVDDEEMKDTFKDNKELFPEPQSPSTAPSDEHEDTKMLNQAGLSALAALYNNLGNLKRQQGGCYNEALAAYEKSMNIDSQNAAVYNNLALLYITVGRFDNALEMLDYALRVEPNFECSLSNRLKLQALIRRKEKDRLAALATAAEAEAEDDEEESEESEEDEEDDDEEEEDEEDEEEEPA